MKNIKGGGSGIEQKEPSDGNTDLKAGKGKGIESSSDHHLDLVFPKCKLCTVFSKQYLHCAWTKLEKAGAPYECCFPGLVQFISQVLLSAVARIPPNCTESILKARRLENILLSPDSVQIKMVIYEFL